MKKVYYLILICCQISNIFSAIYLRSWNDRGPGAVNSGIKCLEELEKIYFNSSQSQQVPNMAVWHTHNLSAPAMEIEVLYLTALHLRITSNKSDEQSFQLKVISDKDTDKKYDGILDVALTDFYVIVGDDMENLNETIEVISRTKSFNAEARFLILFNNPDKREGGKNIACKFLTTLFSKFRAVNVVIIYAFDAFSYEIFIGDPYGTNGENCVGSNNKDSVCGTMAIVEAGKCTRGKISNYDETKKWLEMDKIPEEMGKECVYTFCARVQEPFINKGCKTGLEITIMNFLQEEMGFGLITNCTNLDRGERDANGKWSDLLGEVRKGKCDIIAGAFFPDYDTHDDFFATDFYLQDYYRFFIPKASYEPRWKGLLNIYKREIWYAALTIFLISWTFWFLAGIFSYESYQHRQIILIFLNVLAVTLGVSANNRPEFLTLRFFFAMLALYSLILTSLYTSKLIDVFTHPKTDYQIDSIEEVLDNEFPIGGRLENYDWFDNDDELDRAIYLRYNHSEAFRPSPETIRQITEGKMALLISQYYVEQTEYRNNIFGVSKEMFSNHLEMLAERGFPLMRRINKILGFFRDAGIASKLFIDFNFNKTILMPIKELKAKLKIMEDTNENLFLDDNEVVLTPEHLEAPFRLLILGLCISTFNFLLELMFNIQAVREFLARVWKPFLEKREKFKQKFFPKKEMQKYFRIRKTLRNVRFTPPIRRIVKRKNRKIKKKKIK
ncbi:hypothetical protein PVAND_003505 [Polypedilum vanderplanki]|uniref:Ionotropic receptor n=1 Tax=Polypedilum vanderplanki TaxID=319348 RepID=A0A9J6BU95_POLVA|nr:hypothetical protein PVAND_003505 [Polypedilum vanderplanki]